MMRNMASKTKCSPLYTLPTAILLCNQLLYLVMGSLTRKASYHQDRIPMSRKLL